MVGACPLVSRRKWCEKRWGVEVLEGGSVSPHGAQVMRVVTIDSQAVRERAAKFVAGRVQVLDV